MHQQTVQVTAEEWELIDQEVQACGAFVPPPGFQAPGAAKPFGGANATGKRKCGRCALQPDGTPTMHPIGQRCDVACKCTVCLSVQHADHSCFVKFGVPKFIKMSADMSTEITRLH